MTTELLPDIEFSRGITKIYVRSLSYEYEKCVILFFVLYGISDYKILRDGVYPYAASLLETWLYLLILAGIYMILRRDHIKEKYNHIFILAAYMSVIVGGITIGLSHVLLPLINEKQYDNFYKTDLLHRMIGNIQLVAQGNLGNDGWMLAVLLTFAVGGAAYLYFEKEFLLEISFLFSVFFLLDVNFNIKTEISYMIKVAWALIYILISCIYL